MVDKIFLNKGTLGSGQDNFFFMHKDHILGYLAYLAPIASPSHVTAQNTGN